MKLETFLEAFKVPQHEDLIKKFEVEGAVEMFKLFGQIKWDPFTFEFIDQIKLDYEKQQNQSFSLLITLFKNMNYDTKIFEATLENKIYVRPLSDDLVQFDGTKFSISVANSGKIIFNIEAVAQNENSLSRFSQIGPFEIYDEKKMNTAINIITSDYATLHLIDDGGQGSKIQLP